MIQVTIGRDSTFTWRPSVLPRLDVAAPSLRLVGASGEVSVPLSAKRDQIAVSQVVNRDTLEIGAMDSADWAGLVGDVGGSCFLYLKGLGQFPIVVSQYDAAGPHLRLAEPLPREVPQGVAGLIISNVFTATIPSGALGDTVDRSGFYEITYQADFDIDGTNQGDGTIRTERGRLRVVRAEFDTGLTARELKVLVPQLEQTRPANRDGWQPLIDSVPILDLVESALPDGVFADQTLASQWRNAHAYKAAEMIAATGYAPNLDPDRMQALYDAEIDRQSRRLLFIDSDDDGAIDPAPSVVSSGLVSLTISNASEITKDYDTDNTRRRPVLNNPNDR